MDAKILDLAYRAAVAAQDLDVAAKIMAMEIEYVECGGRELSYVNTGETYEDTVCYEEGGAQGGYFVCSWGAWYEEAEAEYEEENDVIRCGYCGEYTPRGEGVWSDVACGACGHCVAG